MPSVPEKRDESGDGLVGIQDSCASRCQGTGNSRPRAQPSSTGKACAGEPFPVAGSEFRSGGGNRRADSSRGRDDDALATDLHGNHCSRDAPNGSTAYLLGASEGLRLVAAITVSGLETSNEHCWFLWHHQLPERGMRVVAGQMLPSRARRRPRRGWPHAHRTLPFGSSLISRRVRRMPVCGGCRAGDGSEMLRSCLPFPHVHRGRPRPAGPRPVRGLPRRAPQRAQPLPGRADRRAGAPVAGAFPDHAARPGEARDLRREGLVRRGRHLPVTRRRSASPPPRTSRSSCTTTTPSPPSSRRTARRASRPAARRHPWGSTTWSTATGAARSRCAGSTSTCCASSPSTAGTQTSCASSSING